MARARIHVPPRTRAACASTALVVLAAFAPSCAGRSDDATQLRELSGVARSGSRLFFVTDDSPASYYVVSIDDTASTHFPIARDRADVVALHLDKPAEDLEDIALLPDGRVAVLSERERCLYIDDGVAVEYPDTLSEFAGRGLEGLAVTRDGGAVRVAVSWEGGYPMREKLPPGNRAAMTAMSPRVFVHDLPRGAVRLGERDGRAVALRVPVPDGEEPDAQRFRAPALVWHRWRGPDAPVLGFVVLLTSQNAASPPAYQYSWLQRFTLDGDPVGDHLDVDAAVPFFVKGANWEGMGWYSAGKSVVLVHDQSDDLATDINEAVVVTLPESWR